jgi:hypothetical protein
LAARNFPSNFTDLGSQVNRDLVTLVRHFLYDQLHPDSELPGCDVEPALLPTLQSAVAVFPSAIATFFAPSDVAGTCGMYRQRIRATPLWRRGDIPAPRYDTILVSTGSDADGFLGTHVARVKLFFSFKHDGVEYPCALVEWFQRVADVPEEETGMWLVQPELTSQHTRYASVIHLDTVLRGIHLLPYFGDRFVSGDLHYSTTLDNFCYFSVNKYIDYHAFETVV